MHNVTLIALVATTLLTGLLAGFFYAWSCSVMVGLKSTDDRTFIDAMQKINIAILNPVFAIGFFGPLIGLPLCVVLLFAEATNDAAMCALLALIAYAAALLITLRKNQPMNLALDAAGSFDQMRDPRGIRQAFEATWVRWNHVRTVTSTLAFLLMVISIVQFAAQ